MLLSYKQSLDAEQRHRLSYIGSRIQQTISLLLLDALHWPNADKRTQMLAVAQAVGYSCQLCSAACMTAALTKHTCSHRIAVDTNSIHLYAHTRSLEENGGSSGRAWDAGEVVFLHAAGTQRMVGLVRRHATAQSQHDGGRWSFRGCGKSDCNPSGCVNYAHMTSEFSMEAEATQVCCQTANPTATTT